MRAQDLVEHKLGKLRGREAGPRELRRTLADKLIHPLRAHPATIAAGRMLRSSNGKRRQP